MDDLIRCHREGIQNLQASIKAKDVVVMPEAPPQAPVIAHAPVDPMIAAARKACEYPGGGRGSPFAISTYWDTLELLDVKGNPTQERRLTIKSKDDASILTVVRFIGTKEGKLEIMMLSNRKDEFEPILKKVGFEPTPTKKTTRNHLDQEVAVGFFVAKKPEEIEWAYNFFTKHHDLHAKPDDPTQTLVGLSQHFMMDLYHSTKWRLVESEPQWREYLDMAKAANLAYRQRNHKTIRAEEEEGKKSSQRSDRERSGAEEKRPNRTDIAARNAREVRRPARNQRSSRQHASNYSSGSEAEVDQQPNRRKTASSSAQDKRRGSLSGSDEEGYAQQRRLPPQVRRRDSASDYDDPPPPQRDDSPPPPQGLLKKAGTMFNFLWQ